MPSRNAATSVGVRAGTPLSGGDASDAAGTWPLGAAGPLATGAESSRAGARNAAAAVIAGSHPTLVAICLIGRLMRRSDRAPPEAYPNPRGSAPFLPCKARPGDGPLPGISGRQG